MMSNVIIAFFLRCCMVKYKGVFENYMLEIDTS